MAIADSPGSTGDREVVILSQWFPPEQAPIGQMLSELAVALTKRGWAVTVVTGFPNHPSGEVFQGYRKQWRSTDYLEGVRVLRCWLYTSTNRAIWRRVLTSLSFSLTAAWAVITKTEPGLILAVSQPLSMGVLLPVLSRVKGAKGVLNVQDLYPDVPISVGLIRNPWLIRLLRWTERVSYRWADGIAVICEGFVHHVKERGAVAARVRMIPNWIDTEFLRPGVRSNAFRRSLGFADEDFVVLYAGSIGYVSGADVLVKAGKLLRDLPSIKIAYIGEGPLVEKIQRMVNQSALTNVVFRPFQERSQLNDVQACADVGVVSLLPGKGKSSVPSKLLGYMAAARPVIASVDLDSETARFVERAGCGSVTVAGDAQALADAIRSLQRDQVLGSALGEAGRQYVVANHSRPVVIDQYDEFLSLVVEG